MKFFGPKASEIKSLCKTLLIGGEAGDGVKSAGKIAALALIKSGYNTFVYDEYPSLIRGGHNSVHVTYSSFDVYGPNKEIDILVCLNRETFDLHKENISSSSVVLYDRKSFEIHEEDIKEYPAELIDLPYIEIIKKNNLPTITKNIVLVSAVLCVMGVERSIVEEIVRNQLQKKPELLEFNLKALNEGYEFVEEYFGIIKPEPFVEADLDAKKVLQKYLMTGNEAISFGAIKSGLQFYAAYPMTPASSILHVLINNSKDFNIVVKQVEDEIAAANMAIGASFAGARSMVGTSGGGFSLMVESVGLAAITETPIVFVISQRPGPATGLPTWTAQGDLLFTLFASQDEFPRIILTPTDPEECFYLSFLAQNLAEKYQLPVFILLDKYLSESLFYFNLEDRKYIIDRGTLLNNRILGRLTEFNRYELTESGISPRSIPGQKGGVHIANSDESDQKGLVNESSENRIQRVNKRFRKALNIKNDLPELNVYGNIKAKTCFITWGSNKGVILESIRRLESIGRSYKLIALNYVEPFPTEEIRKFIESSKNIILVENNFTSQLGKLISMNLGLDINNKILKYDGRNIFPDEIINYVLENSL